MNNKIKYDIPVSGTVTIKIVDIVGTPVRVMLNEHKEAGVYEVSLDAESLTSGKYYYKVLFNALNRKAATGKLNEEETIASGQVNI